MSEKTLGEIARRAYYGSQHILHQYSYPSAEKEQQAWQAAAEAVRQECERELREENARLFSRLETERGVVKSLTAELEQARGEVEKAVETAEANIRAEIADGGKSCYWCEEIAKKEAYQRGVADERGRAATGWQLCPKCHGQGVVAFPPNYPAGCGATTSQTSWTCDVCNGAKVLAITTPPAVEVKP